MSSKQIEERAHERGACHTASYTANNATDDGADSWADGSTYCSTGSPSACTCSDTRGVASHILTELTGTLLASCNIDGPRYGGDSKCDGTRDGITAQTAYKHVFSSTANNCLANESACKFFDASLTYLGLTCSLHNVVRATLHEC